MTAVRPDTSAIGERPRRRRAARPGPGERESRYLNRELSWLEFNARVLHEARDERNPLLERVQFLTIFAAQPRRVLPGPVAGLRQQARPAR